VTVVLDWADDWHKWLFTLLAPIEPQLSDHNKDATSLPHLTAAQQKLFRWEYEQWEHKDLEFRHQEKALVECNSGIGKTMALKHLYLIENKNTPYKQLTTLK
jgi:hypothetical protein